MTVDFSKQFHELGVPDSPAFPPNDIGVSSLFSAVCGASLRYVVEQKTWYFYTGQVWKQDIGHLNAMEHCKAFADAYSNYICGSCDDEKVQNFATKITSRKRRECILADARSIAPIGLDTFDGNKMLLNCYNGTFNLNDMTFRAHNPADYVTKMTRAKYDPKARCARWERFIGEVMCGDVDTARYLQKIPQCIVLILDAIIKHLQRKISVWGSDWEFRIPNSRFAPKKVPIYAVKNQHYALGDFLQKVLGYSLTGDTSLEKMWLLYGQSTRNGKSTTMETVAFLLGDYAKTASATTISHRATDGSKASPDIARLMGTRLVNINEPDKDLILNAALVKQLTGGDTLVARFLNENLFEFLPESKFFINTNHLPQIVDSTVFTSGRVVIIPFERHFTETEQDKNLKHHLRRSQNMSGILNWFIEGYRLLKTEGLEPSVRIKAAITEYAQESDTLGLFLAETIITAEDEDERLSTAMLYNIYTSWAKSRGNRPLRVQAFVAELRNRYEIFHDRKIGNVIIGAVLKK